jgi:hypothetical protein
MRKYEEMVWKNQIEIFTKTRGEGIKRNEKKKKWKKPRGENENVV